MIYDLKYLTVLIPVYNADVTILIESLAGEIVHANLADEVSIICLDDGSSDKKLVEKNQSLVHSFKDCGIKYFVAKKNSGRTRARNKLIRLAHSEWILFLDSDVKPDSPTFIRDYLKFAKSNQFDVICGGTSYDQRNMMGKKFDFYFDLMKRASKVSLAAKNLDKWRYVLTSNILAKKAVFRNCDFDKRFKTYGYEDQEWAIRASQRFRVIHIENSVSHLGLQTRSEFFQKMRISIKNYLLIKTLHPQIFAQTALSRILQILSLFPNGLLVVLDRALFFACSRFSLPIQFSYLLYQLDKAVLLSILVKKEDAKV